MKTVEKGVKIILKTDGKDRVALAIETSCRLGGLALSAGWELIETVSFDSSHRHATALVDEMARLISRHSLRACDLDFVFVSVGPGSFTGVRVGVTVARTLAQTCPGIKCVAVPTDLAAARNSLGLPWEHLGVVFDARSGQIYARTFHRTAGQIEPDGEAEIIEPAEFLKRTPRPLLLTGEGLEYHDLTGEGVTLIEPALRLPTAEGVWHVGLQRAAEGVFTPFQKLLPIYVRPPRAIVPPRLG